MKSKMHIMCKIVCNINIRGGRICRLTCRRITWKHACGMKKWLVFINLYHSNGVSKESDEQTMLGAKLKEKSSR